MEGLAYRLLPIRRTENTPNDIYYGRIDQERMHNNLVNNFKYTGLDDTKVHFDEHIREVIIGNYRNAFFRLASSYVDQINRAESDMALLRVTLSPDPAQDGPESAAVRSKMAEKEAYISDRREKVRELIGFMHTHITYEASPSTVNFMVIISQLLDASGLTEMASEQFLRLQEKALDEIRFMRANRIRIDPNGMTFRSLLVAVQFFARNNNVENATQLANEIKSLTGSDAGLEVIQREQMQLQLQNR
jgi:hypothetical protein